MKASSVRAHAGLRDWIAVNDKLLEFLGEVDWGEEEVLRGKDAPRRTVGRIACGIDVSCGEDNVAFFQKAVNPFEHAVCFGVTASARPPSFHDPCVVAIDLDTWWATKLEKSPDEEFHGNGFRPADLSSVLVPAR